MPNILLAILLKIYLCNNTPSHTNKCFKISDLKPNSAKNPWCCVWPKYHRKWKEPTTAKSVVVLFTTSFCGEVGFGIWVWNFASWDINFSVVFDPKSKPLLSMCPWKELNFWFFSRRTNFTLSFSSIGSFFSRQSSSLFIFRQFSVTCSAFYGSDIGNFVPFVTSQLILSNADVQGNQNSFWKHIFQQWIF